CLALHTHPQAHPPRIALSATVHLACCARKYHALATNAERSQQTHSIPYLHPCSDCFLSAPQQFCYLPPTNTKAVESPSDVALLFTSNAAYIQALQLF